jgi:hypothetical protein
LGLTFSPELDAEKRDYAERLSQAHTEHHARVKVAMLLGIGSVAKFFNRLVNWQALEAVIHAAETKATEEGASARHAAAEHAHAAAQLQETLEVAMQARKRAELDAAEALEQQHHLTVLSANEVCCVLVERVRRLDALVFGRPTFYECAQKVWSRTLHCYQSSYNKL